MPLTRPRLSLCSLRTWLMALLGGCVATLTLPAAAALADLKLCNQTPSRVGVAIGYREGTAKDANAWVTEGWWNIASQTCETLLKGKLVGRFYYIHAIDYDRGGEWAGTTKLCTADKKFTIRGAQDCTNQGNQRAGFFEVDTGEAASDWTIRLADPGDNGAKPR